jgi:hypothetical protein
MTTGPISGILTCFYMLMHLWILLACEFIWPKEQIDIAEEFNYEEYSSNPEKFGDHMFRVDETKTPAVGSKRSGNLPMRISTRHMREKSET